MQKTCERVGFFQKSGVEKSFFIPQGNEDEFIIDVAMELLPELPEKGKVRVPLRKEFFYVELEAERAQGYGT